MTDVRGDISGQANSRCESFASVGGQPNPPRLDPGFLARELAAHGARMTAQRRMILQVIGESEDHLDAASLLRRARSRDTHIHRATVYRTLDLLKRYRLIDELDLMHLEGEKHFYEARNKSEHFHLACLRCGRIVEHRTPTFERLKAEISRQTGFSIAVIRLEVGGECPACRSGKTEREPATRGDSQYEQSRGLQK
jgi:Fur family transcriptional regulator, ferric uptake regulator